MCIRDRCYIEKYINPFTDYGTILPKAEQDKYHKNLKVYRDLVNSFDTAREEGIEQGIKQIAKSLLDVLDSETIAMKTGLSVEEIEELRDL